MWWEQPTSMWFAQQCFAILHNWFHLVSNKIPCQLQHVALSLLQWTQKLFHIPIYVDMTFWIEFPNADLNVTMWVQFLVPLLFLLVIWLFFLSNLEQCQLICWCTWCNFKLISDSCNMCAWRGVRDENILCLNIKLYHQFWWFYVTTIFSPQIYVSWKCNLSKLFT
jgi:hypothetical protein